MCYKLARVCSVLVCNSSALGWLNGLGCDEWRLMSHLSTVVVGENAELSVGPLWTIMTVPLMDFVRLHNIAM